MIPIEREETRVYRGFLHSPPLGGVRLRVLRRSGAPTSNAPVTAPAARSPLSRSRPTTGHRSFSTLPPRSFGRWRSAFAEALVRAGVPGERAARLGALVVSAVEGAIVLSRAERDSAPLVDVADELEAVLRSALPAGRLEAESPNDA